VWATNATRAKKGCSCSGPGGGLPSQKRAIGTRGGKADLLRTKFQGELVVSGITEDMGAVE